MEYIDAEAAESDASASDGTSDTSLMSDMNDDDSLSEHDDTSESEAESTSVSDGELLRQYTKLGHKIRSRQLPLPEIRAKRPRLVSSSSDD